MTLSDNMAYRQVIGCLMKNTLLFLEYSDLNATDFDNKVARICFIAIHNLYEEGATKLTTIEVEQEILRYEGQSAQIYNNNNGLDFLKESYEFAQEENFSLYYERIKKYALLRRLKKDNYDISSYYKEERDIQSPLEEQQMKINFDTDNIENILNNVESKYNIIRNDFLKGGRARGNPADGVFELIDELQKTPNIGPNLEGDLFSTACRGARQGCFYLKSASSGSGKSRTLIYDACRIAYPIRYSHIQQSFIHEVDFQGQEREPQKVLYIVTEMDKEEVQTIMLSYLSGVNEAHILTGKYEFDELSRVKYAAKIIQTYNGYFFIEEIPDPNLVNIEATIRKYATIEGIKYCCFDYIHSTASMIGQFEKNGINEASILMMMANQIKQLAKDYKLFIFSATQVNMSAMDDDGEFKNEMSIRGSKAVADKADVAVVMTRIREKAWNSVMPTLRQAARAGYIDPSYLENPTKRPTHIIDIYKNRRGSFKNVRIWTYLNLGNGERYDLFMTTADNQPLNESIDLFHSAREIPFDFREDEKT